MSVRQRNVRVRYSNWTHDHAHIVGALSTELWELMESKVI